MSGHSKWSTIKRQKEATDARRGAIFTKVGDAIAVAVRKGGGITDPEKNFALRLAIEKARQFNMPSENVKRAIERGAGKEKGTALEEVTYEGYGPGGIAIIVEAATDNKQRTAQEVKNIFERKGGTLAGPGAVSYQFSQMGLLTLEKPKNVEEAILKIIDLGVEDVEEAQDAIEVYSQPQNLEIMKQKLAPLGFKVSSSEIVMRPKQIVEIKDPGLARKVLEFADELEEISDVQKIFANFDIPPEIVSQAT